jgi:hypothetical protein
MATSCRRSNRRIATPALVTNAYVPALAAEEFGVYREEGLDARVERLPSLDAVNALRDGAVGFETITKLGVSPPGASLPATDLGSTPMSRHGPEMHAEVFDHRPGHARSSMMPNVWPVVPRMSQSAVFW